MMEGLRKGKAQNNRNGLDGRQLLEIIVRKWGVPYDLQFRKNTPFGEGSANLYINGIFTKKFIRNFKFI